MGSTKQPLHVFKFGGASVKDANAVRNVVEIVKNHTRQGRLLIVVSAMGKTTNALEDIWRASVKGEDTTAFQNQIRIFHFAIIDDLFAEVRNKRIKDGIDRWLLLMNQSLSDQQMNSQRLYDQVVSLGELMSTMVIAAYLKKLEVNALFMDARNFIQTDTSWQEALVDWSWSEKVMQSELEPILEKDIVITQGFVGGTMGGATTTLGREGSDFSAAIFAHCLNADSVTIWKDVDGILNGDPKRVKEPVLYEQLPYHLAAEMTYYGASVIHPKTIRPLATKKIPLYVRSFIDYQKRGTCISDLPLKGTLAPAVIFKKNQMLFTFKVKDLSNVNRNHLRVLFTTLEFIHLQVNMMCNTAISVTVCTDNQSVKTKKIIELLSKDFDVFIQEDLELLTLMHPDNLLKEHYNQEPYLLSLHHGTLSQYVRVAP